MEGRKPCHACASSQKYKYYQTQGMYHHMYSKKITTILIEIYNSKFSVNENNGYGDVAHKNVALHASCLLFQL
jgi:hypothetical protein